MAGKRKRKVNSPYGTVTLDTSALSVEEDGPTEYELRRQRNIEERKKCFRELQLGDAKELLLAATNVKKKTPSRSIRVIPPPRPKSLRLQQKTPTGGPLPAKSAPVFTVKSAVDSAIERKPSGPLPMQSAIGEKRDAVLKQIVEGCNVKNQEDFIPQKKFSCELEKFKKELCRLSLAAEGVAKVVPHRIYSMAVHPSESKLLLAVGDKWGNLGLWNVHSENSSECVELFQPHAGPVNCTSFCTYDATKIYTTSHDGTVRCGDLNKFVFDEIYSSDYKMPRCHTTWHCQVEESSLMIAHGNGKIAFVDSRAERQIQGWYSCHERSVRTVQMHPLQPQYFITSSALCEVNIWDRRYLKMKSPNPVCNLVHPKSLSSAFFSPAGKYVLTTCNDDHLRVYDVTNMLAIRPNVVTCTRHNTHTGQWLTTFKATWHPQRDDVYIVGSMDRPRGILLYNNCGELLHKLVDENLTTVSSICAFHPTQQVIFGGNSSGKVYVFM